MSINLEKTTASSSSRRKVKHNPLMSAKINIDIFDVDSIDATQDPALNKMVKTSSYTELEEVLDPTFPINIFVSGPTGLGKSTSVLHIKRSQNNPVIRVNLTYNTDVDDIIGGIRLKDGNTVFDPGPVIEAMQIPNCTLLLDEVTQANTRVLMELQSILEGKGYLVKKTGEMIFPAEGFNVVATGNSKGRGDITNEYAGENILNKAFLDRFAADVEFEYPSKIEMKKIINADVPGVRTDVAEALAAWYSKIVESEKNGVSTEVLSPRRIGSIAKMMMNAIHRNSEDTIITDQPITKAMVRGIKRFDEEVYESFKNIWEAIAPKFAKSQSAQPDVNKSNGLLQVNDNGKYIDEDGNEIPF